MNYKGLTSKEAEISRREHGSNDIAKKKKDGFFKQYLSAFGDPIIKILLIALAINVFLMFGKEFNWFESAGIAIAVLLATLVSTLSEYGSESAFEKLQEDAAKINCRVIRNGKLCEFPIGEIVVGDVVSIQAGERIPADGKLLEGYLSADQSALNGEAKEERKRTGNRVLRGSIVCEGEGVMSVTNVGDNSVYGKIAAEIQEETIESPLKARLASLAKTISIFGYIAAAIVATANLFNNIVIDNNFNPVLIMAYVRNSQFIIRDLMKAFTLAITVIVMAVPEGLPMMITVVLSANMRRMLKDNVLVRKLLGIETSGSLNILFTDKTGTLTKGKLEATSFIDEHGNVTDLKSLKKQTEIYDLVKINCYFNNSAKIGAGGKIIGGNSTDRALLDFVRKDLKNEIKYEKGTFVPFNSRDKFSASEVITGQGRRLFVKGAPEILLPHCVGGFDKVKELNDKLKELAGDSIRIIALCASERNEGLKNLRLIGFIGIHDEIRKEARAAIRDVMEAGVQVVMVTGDNKDTAVSVAKKCGLIDVIKRNTVLTSDELNNMTDSEVKNILDKIKVIARALPSDKSRLVRLAQEKGLVAGMTGDGVNDSPALKRADVGFAMGDGTEIAKEAGDIVILDNNFASIVKAILYGRTIFKSIRKFLVFQLTINLCAVGVSVIGPFIGIELPVTVIQMLWVNMIMDTLAGLAYAGEVPLKEYMKETPKERNEKIINRYMFSQIVFTGLYTTIMCLLFLKAPLISTFFRTESKYMMTAFFALFIFAGVFNSFNARTHRINLLSHIYGNKVFLIIMALVSVIQVLLIYYGGSLFRTAGLLPRELLVVVLIASSVIVVDLARKTILRINNRKGFI